jgi:hypothetical protein
MFIRLTNASPAFKGMPLAIRSNIVLSVFSTTINREPEGDQTTEVVTIVYSTQASWEVKETVDQVLKQLNKV